MTPPVSAKFERALERRMIELQAAIRSGDVGRLARVACLVAAAADRARGSDGAAARKIEVVSYWAEQWASQWSGK